MVHIDYLAGIDHHDMPYWGGAGNTNQWPGNARAAGIPVDHHATPHSIAIKFHGPFGHAMYVRGVAGNGGIYVSQYNEMYQGHFSESYVSPATIRQYNIVFLHF
jgi:surface antigen